MDARELLDGGEGSTPAASFAEDAGITLRDEPMPLWQLLVLAQLFPRASARTSPSAPPRPCGRPDGAPPKPCAQPQERASSRLWAAAGIGATTNPPPPGSPRTPRSSSSAGTTTCENCATRRPRPRSRSTARARGAHNEENARAIARLLQEFDGIGPTGAGIFLREVQGVWSLVHPYADPLVLKGAQRLGLPTGVDTLFADVPTPDAPRLAAALVRAAKQPAKR